MGIYYQMVPFILTFSSLAYQLIIGFRNNFILKFNGVYVCVTDLVKSQKLPANILTPTTKAADHDVPVTPDEV